MFGKITRIHFVGIGGSGMSGIAQILHNMGYTVSGSDINRSRLTDTLQNQGIKIFYEHNPTNCENTEVVVYSSAIKPDNPEIISALNKKIPVIPRAEMLAELMRMKYSIAVSGTHGKTTVTSMIGTMLDQSGFNPTVIIGGRVLGSDTGAKLGTSQYLVAEADESDCSFLLLYPTLAVVTNIEREHLDYYKNISEIRKAFVKFVNKIPFFGTVIVNSDCNEVKKIISKIKRSFITFGINKTAQVRAEKIKLLPFSAQFKLRYNSQSYDFKINLAGVHNIKNALAAICVGLKLELPLDQVARSLENFKGVHRRLEFKGEKNQIRIYDDYGHHPTEIKATLTSLRNAFPNKRIITVFQPHRYTRTKFLVNDFASCFDATNILILTKIYSASEMPIPNVSTEIIIEAVSKAIESNIHSQISKITYKETFSDIIAHLLKILKADDIVITMGAGNIWQIGEELLKQL